jgi:ectoine hydroxylase-related dioxygenase (phytanoyl-CoA dioxygenase family)
MTHDTSLAAQYERDGFLVARDLLDSQECAALKIEGLKVLSQHARAGSTVYVGAAVNSELFYRLASHAGIVRVLHSIMPGGIMFMSDKLVFKSGVQPKATPWHCDNAYWRNTRPKLSVWIALDDVTAQNGAMRVLPGGHHQDWQHSSPAPGEEFGNRIQNLNEETVITCEMKAGSALFFSDRLPHSSTPNSNGKDRYAIISTYHAPAPDEEFDTRFAARHVIVPVEIHPAFSQSQI